MNVSNCFALSEYWGQVEYISASPDLRSPHLPSRGQLFVPNFCCNVHADWKPVQDMSCVYLVPLLLALCQNASMKQLVPEKMVSQTLNPMTIVCLLPCATLRVFFMMYLSLGKCYPWYTQRSIGLGICCNFCIAFALREISKERIPVQHFKVRGDLLFPKLLRLWEAKIPVCLLQLFSIVS